MIAEPVTLADISRRLHQLRDTLVAAETFEAAEIEAISPELRDSARNLVHYLALRSRDLRDLQRDLSDYGLSSLGRNEARVLAGLDEVIATVDAMATGQPRPEPDRARDAEAADRLLERNATALLGPAPGRATRIMVTMPPSAAGDERLVDDMTRAGMDVARINCAHDDAAAWEAMIENVRAAADRRARPGRIVMDLGGPKLRTGPIQPVLKEPKDGEEPVAKPGFLMVHAGDEVQLTSSLEPVAPTTEGPHRIGCTLPEALRDARVGHRILFDDGKIEGVITATGVDGLTIRVTRAGVGGAKLKAEKGINLPDTTIAIPALTDDDRTNLAFIAEHADVVALSFARSVEDVNDLIAEFGRIGAHRLGIILKVETASGFEALPAMLLAAMRVGPVGVMIARGDLAVEVGFERLAEVQEELLWLCEAAHAPAIWATQVLDTLARTGAPSRSEVTDAAMGRRAECVMLNKGPFIVDTISALDGILCRMGGHVDKKRSLLRRLRAWEDSLERR